MLGIAGIQNDGQSHSNVNMIIDVAKRDARLSESTVPRFQDSPHRAGSQRVSGIGSRAQ